MKLTNTKIARARAAVDAVRYTGSKTEVGTPEARHFPKELRKFDYALFRTSESMDRAWEGFQKRITAKREEFVKTVKVDTGEVDDKGKPVTNEQTQFKTVKAANEYKDWIEAEMEEDSEVNVHMVTDEKTIKFLEEDLEDEFYPAIYELEFIWKEDA